MLGGVGGLRWTSPDSTGLASEIAHVTTFAWYGRDAGPPPTGTGTGTVPGPVPIPPVPSTSPVGVTWAHFCVCYLLRHCCLTGVCLC